MQQVGGSRGALMIFWCPHRSQPHACAGLRENNADIGSHRACARVEAWSGPIVCVLAALTMSVSSVATRSCMTILPLSHLRRAR